MWAIALQFPGAVCGLILGSRRNKPDICWLMPSISAPDPWEEPWEEAESSPVRSQNSAVTSKDRGLEAADASDAALSESREERLSRTPTFEEVYDAQFAFVWRLVKRQGVPDEHVDDVCQEVFIIVHRRLPEFEVRAKVRTWIYQIVTNVVRNQRRSIQRKSVHVRSCGPVLDPDEIKGEEPSPEVGVRQKEAAAVAREILMEMSEKRRMVFVLAELEGMSLKEVAEATGEGFHTVRSQLRTAREEFQRQARRRQKMTTWGPHG